MEGPSGSAASKLRRAAGVPTEPDPPSTKRNPSLGYAAAVGAALIAGLTPTLAKARLEAVDPLLIAGITNLAAGLVLLPLAPVPKFDRPDLNRIAFIALAGVVIGPALYFTGLKASSASEGSMLINVETAFTFTLAVVILREHAGRFEVAAILAILTGAIVLTTNLERVIDPAHLAGNALIMAATLAWAFDNVVSTGLSKRNKPQQVAVWKNLLGAPVVLALALGVGASLAPASGAIGWLLLLGAGIGVSLYLFYLALRHIGAYRTSAIFGMQSLFGAVGAFALLGERLSLAQVAAAGLMIAAVFGLALAHTETSKSEGAELPPRQEA